MFYSLEVGCRSAVRISDAFLSLSENAEALLCCKKDSKYLLTVVPGGTVSDKIDSSKFIRLSGSFEKGGFWLFQLYRSEVEKGA